MELTDMNDFSNYSAVLVTSHYQCYMPKTSADPTLYILACTEKGYDFSTQFNPEL